MTILYINWFKKNQFLDEIYYSWLLKYIHIDLAHNGENSQSLDKILVRLFTFR